LLKFRQPILFALSGALGFVVDAGLLYVFLHLGLGYGAGRLASFFCAVFVTWKINRRHTFEHRHLPPTWGEWWRYLSAMAVGGVLNLATYMLALHALAVAGALKPLLAVAAGSLAGMVVNFISAKRWVFRRCDPIRDQVSAETPMSAPPVSRSGHVRRTR
jgi:putative flippase GtrA